MVRVQRGADARKEREKKPPKMQGVYYRYDREKVRVFDTGTHTETGEKLVIFRYQSSELGTGWQAMPADKFNGTVTIDGKEISRFKKWVGKGLR